MILSAADSRWIDERWAKWEPLARLDDLQRGGNLSHRAVHLSRITATLNLDLPRATIHRYSLDDPRRAEADFRRTLAIALERRRSRMGRTKGISNRTAKGASNANRT